MSKLWQKLVRPLMFRIDPERAHDVAIKALKLGIGHGDTSRMRVELGEIELFGLKFVSPLGVAAGFDKNGEVVDELADVGFGYVEVGTITYDPQPGNPKPRLFRLPDDHALINRLGFNNEGARAIAARLKKLDRKCVVGVNIGRNKNVSNAEATENYIKCFDVVYEVADYIAVNISSPNTPHLRELQRADSLAFLLSAVQERNRELSISAGGNASADGHYVGKPLLIKIAPDLSEEEIEGVVDIALQHDISGIIATNTTVSRAGLKTVNVDQIGAGGLSGRPLATRSDEVISKVYRYSKGKLSVIGVGGVFTAEDAFAKIAAGASLIQAYTGFIYGGPSFAQRVNEGLSAMIKERGFTSINEAVGSANKV